MSDGPAVHAKRIRAGDSDVGLARATKSLRRGCDAGRVHRGGDVNASLEYKSVMVRAKATKSDVVMRLHEIESLAAIVTWLLTPGRKIRFDDDPKTQSRGISKPGFDRDRLLKACDEILRRAPRRAPDREERVVWARGQLGAMRERGELCVLRHVDHSAAEIAAKLAALYLLDENDGRRLRYIEIFADFAPPSIVSHDYVVHKLDEYLAPLISETVTRGGTTARRFRAPEGTNYAGLIAEDLADRLPGVAPRPRERTRTGVQKRRRERRERLLKSGIIA